MTKSVIGVYCKRSCVERAIQGQIVQNVRSSIWRKVFHSVVRVVEWEVKQDVEAQLR